MSRRTQHRSLETRRKILDSARVIASEGGYGGLTTTGVASRAGVAKGTVFAHFGDKAGLLAALMVEELAEISVESSAGGDGDVVPLFVDLVWPFVRFLSREREIYRVYLHRAGADDEHPNPDFFAELCRFQDGLRDVVAAWQADGRVRADLPAKTLASGIVAFLDHVVSSRHCGEIPTEDTQRNTLEELLRGWLPASR